jgi:ABC-2 type transport system ATP-binding protein
VSIPTVIANGVTKRFGPTVALADVDIELSAGITGLLGPNGAGKTTLLRILATVLGADRGTLDVLGEDPTTSAGRLAVRRRLGYLPQEPGFHRSFSAFEFVDYVAILKEWSDRRARHDEVRRVLTLVGLDRDPQAVRRHAPAGRDRAVAHRRPRPARPRRADRGPRP